MDAVFLERHYCENPAWQADPEGICILHSLVSPGELGRLLLRIRYRMHSLEVEITPKKLKIRALKSTAKPIQVGVKGEVFKLKMDETEEVEF